MMSDESVGNGLCAVPKRLRNPDGTLNGKKFVNTVGMGLAPSDRAAAFGTAYREKHGGDCKRSGFSEHSYLVPERLRRRKEQAPSLRLHWTLYPYTNRPKPGGILERHTGRSLQTSVVLFGFAQPGSNPRPRVIS